MLHFAAALYGRNHENRSLGPLSRLCRLIRVVRSIQTPVRDCEHSFLVSVFPEYREII